MANSSTKISKSPNRTCQFCGKPFYTKPCYIAKGNGKYCSRICKNAGRVATENTFWSHVDKTSSECWLWQGGISKNGYGNTVKRVDGKTVSVNAHRRVWELTFGEIPPRMDICHNCPGGDNRLCVRPAHLFLGSPADNNRDTLNKGRLPYGENHGRTHLTDLQVLEIRQADASVKGFQFALAKKYGVNYSTINRIILGKSWKHLLV